MIEEYGIGYCIQGDYMGRIMIPSFNNMGIVDYFISRCRIQAHKCKFSEQELDDRVIEIMIIGDTVQETLLGKNELLTLDMALDSVRTQEAT